MTKVLRGVVHGRTIQLEEDSGLEDGRLVEVVLQSKLLPVPPPGWSPDSAESAAGLLSTRWTEEDDRILEEIYRDRKRETGRGLAG